MDGIRVEVNKYHEDYAGPSFDSNQGPAGIEPQGNVLIRQIQKRAPMYTYNAKIERIVDGDTIDLVIDVGFKLYFHQRTRLRGIDAPELSTVMGKTVKEFLISALPVGTDVVVTTYKGDKYGRWLTDIHLSPNMTPTLVDTGKSTLNEALLQLGYAVPYA